MATTAQRKHLHDLMVYLLKHEPQVHYPPHDNRTSFDVSSFHLSEQQLHNLLDHGGSIQADCSEMVTEICHWAGLRDPNGLNYRYAGYTGTLLATLPHYSDPKYALVGGLCVYGPGTGDHVSMVVEKNETNPLMFSHGREAGPLTVRWEEEKSWHRPPARWLSIQHL